MASNASQGLSLLHEYCQKAVEEQAKIFLRTFVMDFRGKFDEILGAVERFCSYRTKKASDSANLVVTGLEEADLYRFIEAEGHPIAAVDFRTEIRALDEQTDRTTLSFIHYCMWNYKKKVEQLVIPPGEADPTLLRLLDEALAEYQKVVDARRARENKMVQLRATAAQGGVKGNIAKSELDQMEASDQLERNKAEVTAAAKRRLAQKAVESDKDGAKARERALKEEQKRLEQERAKKEAEEKRIQDEKRAKLKAKSAMFEHAGAATAPPPVAAKGAAPAKKWAPVGSGHSAPAPVVSQPAKPIAQDSVPPSGGVGGKAAMFAQAIANATPQEPVVQKRKVSHGSKAAEPAVVHHQPEPVHVPEPVNVPEPAVSSPAPPVVGEQARSLYPYQGNSETELSFPGDVILTIHHKDPAGWWSAEYNGVKGWIPANYVQLL